ncbi:2-methoxy-6-polyprenyl-1,4-benzoquinol methylase [Acrasis kona]|uniref:2-methoxy-6-polyprenyl-1,4-benzoquinol methylase, mitochondrial n=1 Tax=Acrasis kona TaxID=1008807 RepID=A0AAW2YQU3_9EUKA
MLRFPVRFLRSHKLLSTRLCYSQHSEASDVFKKYPSASSFANVTSDANNSQQTQQTTESNTKDSNNTQSETHFGYKTVPEHEKQKMVHEVFRNVADKYDLMNDLMSGTMHRIWKDQMIGDHYRPQIGGTYLDVAGGTGDVAFRIAEYLKRQHLNAPNSGLTSRVIVSDINANMLEVGRQKSIELNLHKWEHHGVKLDWLEGNAEDLSETIPDRSIDGYTIAFGIRNVTHIDKAIKEAHRVLKPGGQFLCLEFSQVYPIALRQFYDWYSFNIIPKIGQVVANDHDSYQYLVESIRQFPPQERFKQMIQDAGFKNVRYTSLTFGVVALHSGIKL